MNSLQAQLLVASPRLPDPNFHRSVVLLINHNEEGAFGVVLNRQSEISISEVWQQVSETPCDNLRPVNVGGPVAGPLIAVHTQESYSEERIMPGIYYATQKELLDQIVSQDDTPYRIFSGYSGWGSGQLESELEVGGWLTTGATCEYIFHDEEDLWQVVAQEIGSDILFPNGPPKHIPDDPSWN